MVRTVFVVVHSLTHVWFFATSRTTMYQDPLSSPLRVSSNQSPFSMVMLSILSSDTPFSYCLQSLPASGSFPMSQLCLRLPKYWSFSFSNSLSSENSRLISFWIDWFDFFAVQGTLQHLRFKASILWHSAFLPWGPTFTSVHDYWKNHSVGYAGLCWQNGVHINNK